MLEFIGDAIDAVGSAVSAAESAAAPQTDAAPAEATGSCAASSGVPASRSDAGLAAKSDDPKQESAGASAPAATDEHHDWVASVFGVDPRSYVASLSGSDASADAGVPP